jgi:hypothetical protein
MGTLSDFAAKHRVIGGIAASLLWFIAGNRSSFKRRPDAAIFWQSVAVVIVLIMCGWSLARKEWLGLVAGIIVLYLEVSSIRRSALNKARQ